MDTEHGSSRLASMVAYGASSGLMLFLGESLVGLLKDNQLKPLFFLVGLPAYVVFGIAVGAGSLLLRRILKRSRVVSSHAATNDRYDVLFPPLMIVLIQGGVILNELVLARSRFFTPISLAFDLAWALLIAALFRAIPIPRAERRMGASRIDVLLGLFLASFSLSSLYHITERPWDVHLQVAAVQTLLAFLFVTVAFLVPLTAYRLSASIWPASKGWGNAASTVATVTAAIGASLLLLADPTGGFERRSRPASKELKGPNVILIVVDTLRADHLSCYGYHHATSPNLDALSRSALRYERCYSPSNWTPPGHASIFTGRYPISHGLHKAGLGRGARHPACFPLDEKETTLAEFLSEAGYRTAAVVANYGFVSKAYGLDQGFQDWFAMPPRRSTPILVSILGKTPTEWPNHLVSDTVPYRRASDISGVALRWIRRYGDQPFFLFINFMDPHLPYSPPEPWDRFVEGKLRRFGPDAREISGLKAGTVYFSELQWDHIRSQYDGEIAYVDSELGEFFETLQEEGRFSNSVIVITSDHGEFLGEKGLIDHQVGLYEPVIRVPLILKPASGTPMPNNSGRLVQTIDIVPTILDMLGLSIPDSIQGRSLRKEQSHKIMAQHYVDDHVAGWFGGRFSRDQIALIDENRKFIQSLDNGHELYDLRVDLEEDDNIAQSLPEISRTYREAIQGWLGSIDVADTIDTSLPEIDEETSRQLEALGYVN